MSVLELVREGLGVAVLNPFPILSAGLEGVAVRPFDAAIFYNTSFVLPAGRPPTQLAQQFIRYVKMMTPKDPYSEVLD